MGNSKRSSTGTRHRIYLVDDHAVPRSGFAVVLAKEPDIIICGQASNANDALKEIPELKPDLIITDIAMPGTSGLDLIKAVLDILPDMPILVFTMYDEGIYGERALRAGARGYLMKNTPLDKLLQAIRDLVHGRRFLSSSMQDIILNRFLNHNNPDPQKFAVDLLSNRELEVLRLIGLGKKSSDIASELGVSVKTIDSHRENIKSKLNLKNSYELIQYAIRWTDQQNP